VESIVEESASSSGVVVRRPRFAFPERSSRVRDPQVLALRGAPSWCATVIGARGSLFGIHATALAVPA
jgi:hypothetical protein